MGYADAYSIYASVNIHTEWFKTEDYVFPTIKETEEFISANPNADRLDVTSGVVNKISRI